MAAGFDLNGTDEYVTLPDNAAYDVSPDGDSIAMQVWVNPDGRTSPEVIFDRSGWFKLELDADDFLVLTLGDRTIKKTKVKVPEDKKTHILWALKHQSAVASGTADTNVASLLIDLDADWWTNGVDFSTDKRGKYVVYNRTDRTYGYGTVIPDVTLTASTSTVSATNDTIDIGSNPFEDGTPVLVKGSDVPAGTADDGTVYYVGDATGGLIYLYDTAANAVTNDGSTGLVDLTDAGSGTVTIRAREDAIALDSDLCPDGNEVVYVFAEPWQAELRVWVNGIRVLDETLPNFNTPADSAEVINVGQLKGGAQFYDGGISNVALWTPGWPNDALAAALYNEGTELTYANAAAADGSMTLLGFWAFDDNAASTTVDNDEGTAGLDGTASGNTSTLTTTTLDETEYWEAERVLKFIAATTVTGRFVIDHMEWDGSVTADDDLVVKDGTDNELWVVNNKTANERAVKYLDQLVDGLEVETIDAGTLYVYLR